MQPRRRGAIILVLFLAATFLSIPRAGATTALDSIAAGKKMRDSTAQGWLSFGSTLYHNGVDHTTSTMFKFTDPALGSSVSAWSTLGFASDTAAVNMTVTLIDTYKVTYTATGAGTQRIYAVDVEPPSVKSGGTGSWDDSTSTLTVTTTGASTVVVEWGVASKVTYDAAQTLASMLTLISILVALGIAAQPKKWIIILQVGAAIAVLAFFAWVFYTLGA